MNWQITLLIWLLTLIAGTQTTPTLIIVARCDLIDVCLELFTTTTIWAETITDVPNNVENTETSSAESDNASTQSSETTADEEKDNTPTGDCPEKENAQSDAQQQARKKSVERIINGFPSRMSAVSKAWLHFPLDYKNINLDSLAPLQKRETETTEDYRIRLNEIFSGMCTLHAAGVLSEDSPWKVFIEETNLCTLGRVINYEMTYLELSEKRALQNNTYPEFVKTSTSELLDTRRGFSLSSTKKPLTEYERMSEANKNYNWLTFMLPLKAMQDPAYGLLKAIWANTPVNQALDINDPARMPKACIEFYLHLSFSPELLYDVLVETGANPKNFTHPTQVRDWLYFLHYSKQDPNFCNFKR